MISIKMKGFKLNSFILLLICLSQISTKLDKKRVVSAINCGGYTFTDSNGITYEKVRNQNKYRIIILI